MLFLKKLEKEEQMKPKTAKGNKVRAELNEIESKQTNRNNGSLRRLIKLTNSWLDSLKIKEKGHKHNQG